MPGSGREPMNRSLEQSVQERAKGRCEYCRFPSYASKLTYPIDHVIARQHGGRTIFENLALSCPHCNYHKGPNIAGIDPVSGRLTRLFNPRRHRWSAHFAWDGPFLVGKTAIGRTSTFVHDMNHPERVEARRLWIESGLFPL